VQAWLRQRPGMSQTLLDALYFPTREWLKGGDRLALHAVRSRFHETLVSRRNLGEVQAVGAAESTAGALSDDDKSFLATMMEEVLRFLCDVPDVTAAGLRWGKAAANGLVAARGSGPAGAAVDVAGRGIAGAAQGHGRGRRLSLALLSDRRGTWPQGRRAARNGRR
jgi:hypothetical protein